MSPLVSVIRSTSPGLKAPPTRARALGEDVGLDKALLNGKKVDVDVAMSITGGEVERTMDGASTVTLNVYDPQMKLLRSGIFGERVILGIDGLKFMLVAISKSGDNLTLTFEDLEVAFLRRNTTPKKAVRGQVTRAEFVLSLVKEVKKPAIKLFSPEMNKTKPIGRAKERKTESEREEKREPGFAKGTKLNIKGKPATSEQLGNLQRALDVAVSLNAPRRAQEALVMALIQESSVRNLSYGHSSSVGILQLLDTWLGGSTSTNGGRRDIELVVNMFLTRGFTGRGGAIDIVNRSPSTPPAEVCSMVQGNARGAVDYAPWQSEADEIVDAFAGGDLPASATTTRGGGKYEFRRGGAGEKESSWDAIGRLAEEVRWRRFMVAGTLYFVSDEYLMRSKPRMRITQETLGVNYIDFDFDLGKPATTATIECRLDRWEAPPGSVVMLYDMGPADGRWLVQAVRRSLFSADATVELRRAQAELPEPPAAQVTTSSGSTSDSQEDSTSGPITPTKKGQSKPLGVSYPTPGPHGAARNAFGTTEAADIMVPAGTPVLAVLPGKIGSQIGALGAAGGAASVLAGLRLHLYSDDGNQFYYAHLQSISVKAGEQVEAGQLLGYSGVANNVAHLHFEVRKGSIKDFI